MFLVVVSIHDKFARFMIIIYDDRYFVYDFYGYFIYSILNIFINLLSVASTQVVSQTSVLA